MKYFISLAILTSTVYAGDMVEQLLCPLKLSYEDLKSLRRGETITKGTAQLTYKGHPDTFAMILNRNPNEKLVAGLKDRQFVSSKPEIEMCKYKLGTERLDLNIIGKRIETPPVRPETAPPPRALPSTTKPPMPPRSTKTPPTEKPPVPPIRVSIVPPDRKPPVPPVRETKAPPTPQNLQDTGTFMFQRDANNDIKVYRFITTQTDRAGGEYEQAAEKKILFIKGADKKIYVWSNPEEDTRYATKALLDRFNVVFTDDLEGKRVKIKPTDKKFTIEGKDYPLVEILPDTPETVAGKENTAPQEKVPTKAPGLSRSTTMAIIR